METNNLSQNGNVSGNGGNERPKSQNWANFGFELPDGTFIALPTGLGLDTMLRNDTRSSNVEFAKKMAAGNDFLDFLNAKCDQLQPGEESETMTIQFRLRKVRGDQEIPSETNEFSIDFAALLTSQLAKTPASAE